VPDPVTPAPAVLLNGSRYKDRSVAVLQMLALHGDSDTADMRRHTSEHPSAMTVRCLPRLSPRGPSSVMQVATMRVWKSFSEAKSTDAVVSRDATVSTNRHQHAAAPASAACKHQQHQLALPPGSN
jgi:hypothetical protein